MASHLVNYSLKYQLKILFSPSKNDFEKVQLARKITIKRSLGMKILARYICSRYIDPSKIIDISYEDLIKNPLGEAKKIYSHFNIDLDIQTENSMVSYLAQSKGDHKRKHIYSPEEFGLSKEIIQNELSFSTKT